VPTLNNNNNKNKLNDTSPAQREIISNTTAVLGKRKEKVGG
jgi:hypothetical protein